MLHHAGAEAPAVGGALQSLLESGQVIGGKRDTVRFEIRYPTGAQHEVELSGTVAVLGRDPSCDLVLNDPKCSRRHAVLEAGPDGIAVRDAGSANGVYVNGKKVERAQLGVGDTIRVGEVTLKVLEEDVPGTLVMAPEDMSDLSGAQQPRPAPAPPAPPPAPHPAPPPPPPVAAPPKPAKPPSPPPQPAAAAPPRPPRPEAPRPAAPSVPRVESRPPASRPPAKAGGSGKTLLIVGGIGCLVLLMLTVAGVIAAIYLPKYLRSRVSGAVDGAVCVARLKAVAASEEAFRLGTCGSYADLDGLTNPVSVIPNYPASGPVFLAPELATPEGNGCRFELTVMDPVAPTAGCPRRTFRRFAATAAPTSGTGRYLMLGSDGIVHAAEGRPATADDPPVL